MIDRRFDTIHKALAVALLLSSCSGFGWAQGFDALLPKVPAGANTIVMIDVQRTLDSPLAREQGWGEKLEAAYVSRPIFLPPEANKLVMAAMLEPGNNFQCHWELAVMELSDVLSMRSIARSEGGYIDTIRDTQVAWTPSDAYFVSLGDRLLGALFPADRQFVSRWIAYAKQNKITRLSQYLRSATQLTNERIQVLMAIDLTDVVQPHELAENIEDSPLFEKSKLTPQQIIDTLSSLRGAVLRVAISDKAQAQLRIDFDQDVSSLSTIAHELVVQTLGNVGAPISEIAEWKTEVQGKVITMEGELTTDGQRRMFSLIELPSAKFSMLKEEGEDSESEEVPESLVRERSVTYFRSVDVLLKDLQRDLKGNKASAAVMERYARKIDRMPILNVDKDLLDFGAGVAQGLRQMALIKREGGIQYGVNTAGMGGGGYANYGYADSYFGMVGDRYQGARASAADRSAMKAEAMASANQARVAGFKSLADATAQIRRQMTEKYGVEF